MPEQNSQNAKAFDPASFSMPDQPTMTYSVIASSNQPELSSYVQTVFHRMQGTNSPGARLSDQSAPAFRTFQDVPTVNQQTPAATNNNTAQFNWAAQDAPAAPMINEVPQHTRSSVQFSLGDLSTTPAPRAQSAQAQGAMADRSNQSQSFAPPVDHSKLPYLPRTDARAAVPAAPETVLDASRGKIRGEGREEVDQNSVAPESHVAPSKPTLVALRKDSGQAETPERDENTIAENPGFLKREPFSNKFTVTISPEEETEGPESIGKIIYLKSVPPVEHTAKLKVPKFVKEKDTITAPNPDPQPVSQPVVAHTPQPQFIHWPLVDSTEEQVLFPAPVATVWSTPTEFVSATPSVDARTTKIDFTEVNQKAATEPSDQGSEVAFDPFQTTEATESPFEKSPFEDSPFEPSEDAAREEISDLESPFQTAPVGSSPEAESPFHSSPAGESPFQSSPFESAPSASPFESSSGADLSENKIDVSENQWKSLEVPLEDTTPPAPPAATVFLASNTQDSDNELDASPIENDTPPTPPAAQPQHDSHFHVVGHRSTEFKQADSRATQAESSSMILPQFKSSLTAEHANEHLIASTLQIDHQSAAQNGHLYDTPWLSPWWMLIGLVPIALYFATIKFFKDEDEYHTTKNELFGRRLEFSSDFGELGRSKSDAVYGRQQKVKTVRGPAGESVSLAVDAPQSSLEFAQSLDFELPTSSEVAQSSFAQEIRIDQSPNFSEAGKSAGGQVKKKKNRRGAANKRSKR